MNKYVLILGFVLIILSIIAYGYYETIPSYKREYPNKDGTTHRYWVYETVYPYRNNSIILAVFGVVTFLSGLAIPKRRD